MNERQLELGLGSTGETTTRRSHGRIARARWWFAQMHKVVDAALEPRPALPASSESARFALARGAR